VLTIIIALTLGTIGLVTGLSLFDTLSGVVMGLIGLVVPPLLIGRRVMKRIQAKQKETEAHMGAQRFDKAIAVLESMRAESKWFPRMGASIDTQIGMVIYATKKDGDRALPYLQKAPGKLWNARAMVAAIHFKRKAYADMENAFENAIKGDKKQALIWAAYAYCQFRRGEKNKAQAVLQRGLQTLPDDARLTKHAASVEKGKPPKMSAYGGEWFSLHIETPKMPAGAVQGGNRFMPPPGKLGVRGKRARMR